MEKYSIYFKKFQIAIAILVLTVIVFAFLVSKIVPVVQNILNIQEQYKTQTESLADSERKLAGLKADAEKKKEEEANVLKAFFKPIEMSLDTEAVMSDEFGEILQLLRDNKIKTRSVKYEYDPQDDNFVKNVGDRYGACRLNIEMVANYSNLENFLRELYKHEHFLDISKIEIVPYDKNKRILLINLQIKLYAQKDPAQAKPAEQPAPAPAENADPNAPQTAPEAPASTEGGVSPELPQ